jgi:sorting nexin-13
LSVNLDERSKEKNTKSFNSSQALNGNLVSASQSLHVHKDDTMPKEKDKDFDAVDGLRSRKRNTEQNLGIGVGNTNANLHEDLSGSDPEQNEHSFIINSGNSKKTLSSETDYPPQSLESDGYSVAPNDVSYSN